MSIIGLGPPESVIGVVGSGISSAVAAPTVAETIISTETVTQTGLTSSVVSTNLPQTGAISSSIPSVTATDSGRPDFPHGSSNPRYYPRFRSLQLGPIVGGVVAVLALILIFVFLLLKHRASQREIRLRAAEIDPIPTPFDRVDTRERLDTHVSVNDDGSEMPRPNVRSSQRVPSANVSLKRIRTNYTVHSSIRDERIHLNSNSSQDLISNSAITEMTHTLTYIPPSPGESLNETDLQTNLTNNFTVSDYAPPAYDSLPARNSHVNSSQPNVEPSNPD